MPIAICYVLRSVRGKMRERGYDRAAYKELAKSRSRLLHTIQISIFYYKSGQYYKKWGLSF